MLLRIEHETRLTYSEPVSESVIEARMSPQGSEDQTVLGYRLRVTPPASVTSYRDGYGNRVDLFNVLAPHQEVAVRASSFVRVHHRPGRPRLAEVAWPVQPPGIDALEFVQASPLVDRCARLDALTRALPAPTGSLADVLDGLLSVAAGALTYENKVTTARTPLSEALDLGRGVCQDFAHLLLGLCRGVGWPARYVSGYLNQPGELATHAWCQVWGGERIGWVDVDPTQRKVVTADHVVTAVGRDYYDVPPNRGVWKGRAQESIAVTVKVEPVDRMPSDWSQLSPASLYPGAAVYQRQARAGVQKQARPGGTLRHQQGQQQQQSRGQRPTITDRGTPAS
jgi:transglutaminase-like putative cysteine protease